MLNLEAARAGELAEAKAGEDLVEAKAAWGEAAVLAAAAWGAKALDHLKEPKPGLRSPKTTPSCTSFAVLKY
jgi:hypothetical protein